MAIAAGDAWIEGAGMMKKLEIAILVGVILWAASLALRNPPFSPPPVPETRLNPLRSTGEASAAIAVGEHEGVLPFDPITRIELLAHIQQLASDAMAGRRTGEPGAERAADYIEQEFRRAGLRPGGDRGSYHQRFTARVGARMGDHNRLVLRAGSRRWELAVDRDWRPLSFSASTHGRIQGRAAFCGYGIASEQPAYDDFAGQDVRGRVVILLRLEPGASDPASPFAGTALTAHADLRHKVENAIARGASAVLITSAVPPAGDGAGDGAGDAGGAPLIGFDAEAGAGGVDLPVAQVRGAALRPALAALGVDLMSVAQGIDTTLRPNSFPLELTCELEVDVEPIEVETANIVGVLPGEDPALRNEAIVVGAHYDHLGRGGPGALAPVPADSSAAAAAADTTEDSIYNGADDNASGVSALIEIAAAIRTDQVSPARTIVFVAFTGEELGLLGSEHYVQSPAITLAHTRAMINLDTIGRGPGGRVFVGGAASSPELKAVVSEESAADFLSVAFDDEVLRASDQASFYARGIPVLFFFTPAHADYHRPTDEWEKIDPHYLESVARLVDRVVIRLASPAETIRFTRVANLGAAEGGLTSESGTEVQGHAGGEGYGTRGYGPYLGTVPDFGTPGEGVRLAAVRAGSPAAVAGLRDGDVIVGWDGREIRNLGDYAQALRSQRPGDQVELTLLRDGSSVRAVAVLAERP
jgi:Zn-dependent M28 family amino/carboxypeptidase